MEATNRKSETKVGAEEKQDYRVARTDRVRYIWLRLDYLYLNKK